jgi:DNA-binding GntR family transcriptional regulator
MKEATEEHAAVLSAIETRQPERAEELARRHIQNAGVARIQQMFES